VPDTPRQANPTQLLVRARGGDERALGGPLQFYRSYLSLLARLKVDRNLQSKMSDSDLVQDTCLSAHLGLQQFLGATEPEFTAWLREIMAHVSANYARDLRRQRRDVRLERRLYNLLNQSSRMLERALTAPDSSPSGSALRRERAGVTTLFIAKGSPWENGHVESFNSRLRDELLDRKLFLGLADARWVVGRWRLDYNHRRRHSSLDYQTSAAFAARGGASAPELLSATPLATSPLQQHRGPLTPDPLIHAGT
jgi:putative transposase